MQNNRLHTIIDRVYPGFPLGTGGFDSGKRFCLSEAYSRKRFYGTISEISEGISAFYYHGYKTEETEFAYKITYDFEIEGLSSFAPTWTFPKTVNDGKIWEKDGLFRK